MEEPIFLRRARRSLKNRLALARRLFEPETNFVLSFPKCGRTWLRLMLGHYLAHHYAIDTRDYLLVGDLRQHKDLPHLAIKHDDKPYKRTPEELDPDKSMYRNDRVIFLCRDPRDVLLSHYYSLKHRTTSYGYDGSLTDYVYERRGSFVTIIAYYNVWARQRHVPRAFLCIRYEDLIAQPEVGLRAVLSFLGIERVEDELLKRSVAYAAFDNMRRLEEEDAFNSKTLRPGDKSDLQTYKTRKGIIGDHLNALAPRELAYVNEVIDRKLDPYFGYASLPLAAATQPSAGADEAAHGL